MGIEDAVKNSEPWGTDRECKSLQSKPSNLEKTGLGVGGMVQPQATGNRLELFAPFGSVIPS